nr:MAG TPA: hypothetical protein [Caudoviricetes sp.]
MDYNKEENKGYNENDNEQDDFFTEHRILRISL